MKNDGELTIIIDNVDMIDQPPACRLLSSSASAAVFCCSILSKELLISSWQCINTTAQYIMVRPASKREAGEAKEHEQWCSTAYPQLSLCAAIKIDTDNVVYNRFFFS